MASLSPLPLLSSRPSQIPEHLRFLTHQLSFPLLSLLQILPQTLLSQILSLFYPELAILGPRQAVL